MYERNRKKVQAMEWKFYTAFEDIPSKQLYDILQLRQNIFIIEQSCFYEDIDGVDFEAEHLLMLNSDELCGYLRIVPPGKHFKEISIGRIIVKKTHRGHGLGAAMVKKGMDIIFAKKPQPIRIEAQAHLENFYSNLGFKADSIPYDLDGIPHLEMLFNSKKQSGHTF